MKYVLLLLPCALALVTPFYNSIDPRLAGFPFFYLVPAPPGAHLRALHPAAYKGRAAVIENLNWPATLVFVFFFAVVTVMGFMASRWKSGELDVLHEWGLGGRRFGAWITWFLLGGDLYTAYTVIAVPALVYAIGAYGFFAVPYTIMIYPLHLPDLAAAVERGAGKATSRRATSSSAATATSGLNSPWR